MVMLFNTPWYLGYKNDKSRSRNTTLNRDRNMKTLNLSFFLLSLASAVHCAPLAAITRQDESFAMVSVSAAFLQCKNKGPQLKFQLNKLSVNGMVEAKTLANKLLTLY